MLETTDKAVFDIINREENRQEYGIELIASENFVSKAVIEAAGSVLTNKYAEGYPGKRYYGGCQFVDEVETLAIERVKEIFGAKYANVQAHSGSQANMAVYMALVEPKDKVMGMALDAGGHLTHGLHINFSGLLYDIASYGVNSETELLDYDEIEKIALAEKPKMIIAGASAYPRAIDFKRFREIADKVGAYLFVDMAHIAGLVAAGEHQNPMDYAHVVTSTTHKTLRGPRGGLILTNDEEIAKKLDKVIFPGIQGGPLMHIIAAKAVAFGEALQPEYKEYQKQVIKNAKALSEGLIKRGFRIVSGGTDNHLLLVDLRTKGLTGKVAEQLLVEAEITCNKNGIPNDPEKPWITSGVRLGTPAVTTRGMKEAEMDIIAGLIARVLDNPEDASVREAVKKEVHDLGVKFPLYK